VTVTLIPGNTRVIYTAVQSAKGTAATTPTRKLRLTGDALDPGRSLITLPETDSTSQQPNPAVVGAEPGNTFDTWLRPNDCDMLLYALQGASADSGSGNYTHSLTPVVATPYLTIWDVVPGYSTTKYVDARIVNASIGGSAGQGITAQWTARALTALTNQTEPAVPASFSTDVAMTYPDVTVTRGGSHAGDVDAFTIDINRGGAYFHGDNGLTAADYVNGLYGCTGSMTLAFQNAQEYSSFNTGATNGTALTTTLYSQALIIAIAIDTNTSVTFTSSGVTYTAFPIGLDTGGGPVTVAAGFQTTAQATWANNMTVSVKNQNAVASA
jgi:Phage tail tube protein